MGVCVADLRQQPPTHQLKMLRLLDLALEDSSRTEARAAAERDISSTTSTSARALRSTSWNETLCTTIVSARALAEISWLIGRVEPEVDAAVKLWRAHHERRHTPWVLRLGLAS